MNSNLFHNIANVLIAVLGLVTAVLVATGCSTLASGSLDCSASVIDPVYTGYATSAMAILKIVVNVLRDGVSGLSKPQPPVK